MSIHAGIDDLTQGMSVQKISEYFEALKVDSIQKAVEACTGPEFNELINALNANWVGTAHDKFVEILKESANVTAETISNMTGALATELNRIIEVWREREDSMIQN